MKNLTIIFITALVSLWATVYAQNTIFFTPREELISLFWEKTMQKAKNIEEANMLDMEIDNLRTMLTQKEERMNYLDKNTVCVQTQLDELTAYLWNGTKLPEGAVNKVHEVWRACMLGK